MADFLNKALKQYPNRAHVLLADNIPYINSVEVTGEESGAKVYIHRGANNTEVSADALVSVQPTTSNVANLDGTIVDFKPQSVIDRFDHAYLKIGFINNSVAPCTIVPSPLLLNYWQIYGGNGNNLLFQQYGYELWNEIASFSNTLEWNIMQFLVGSNATYSTAGVTLAAAATTSLYIPLASVFMSARLYVPGLKDNMIIRFTFNPSSQNLIAGTTPSVTSMQLLLRGAYDAPGVRSLKEKLYNMKPLDFPYVGCQRTPYTQSIIPGGSYKIQLQGINGLVSCLWIYAQATPVTAATAATYSDIFQNFDITDNNGNSIIGYYQRDVADFVNFRNDNQISTMEYFDNQYSVNKNFLFLSFSRTPIDDWRTGSSHGFQPFDGFNVLNFTAKSTAIAASYQITVLCRTYETLKVRRGILSTTRN
jgi:hypothetical protein